MSFGNLAKHLKPRRATFSAAVAVAAAASLLTASPAAAMYIDPHTPGEIGSGLPKCLPGYVCVFSGLNVYSYTQPEHRYYNYGSYNFVNEFGNHSVYNNQTGGARALLCLGYNGTNCNFTIPAGKMAKGSLTPYNSIKLVP